LHVAVSIGRQSFAEEERGMATVARLAETSLGRDPREKSPHRVWVEGQGVPISEGFSVEDLTKLPVASWGDTGLKAHFLNLVGACGVDDAWVCEIPPGGQSKPRHHVYDMMVYILSGRGAASVWLPGKKKQTFEWQRRSIFAIPLNASYEFYNGSGSEPARFIAVTTAPLIMNMVPDHDFIFNNRRVFSQFYNGQEDYFSAEGEHAGQTLWKANFIADCVSHQTDDYQQRGAGGTNMHFSLGGSLLRAHVSDFSPGTYKKAHRHGPGAHVFIVKGAGYSLNWHEGKGRVQVDWKDGSLYVPPNLWWHQHFNPYPENARYLAITLGHISQDLIPMRTRGGGLGEGGDQMDYEEQDPWIMQHFQEECAKRGVKVQAERMTKKFEQAVKAPPVEFSRL
jgi:uncharacterized RmlC-like cupin family protein